MSLSITITLSLSFSPLHILYIPGYLSPHLHLALAPSLSLSLSPQLSPPVYISLYLSISSCLSHPISLCPLYSYLFLYFTSHLIYLCLYPLGLSLHLSLSLLYGCLSLSPPLISLSIFISLCLSRYSHCAHLYLLSLCEIKSLSFFPFVVLPTIRGVSFTGGPGLHSGRAIQAGLACEPALMCVST